MGSEINLLDDVEEISLSEDRGEVLRKEMKGAVEALLFSSSDPISFNKIRSILEQMCPIRPKELKEILAELKTDYKDGQRAFQLEELSDGYQLRTLPRFSEYVEVLRQGRRPERLSRAATEVLAIIAHRQPVTRSVIEGIRGVDSSGALISLVERELVAPVGRLDAPGRPTIYSVTSRFLHHYGLKSLKELTGEEGEVVQKDLPQEGEEENS